MKTLALTSCLLPFLQLLPGTPLFANPPRTYASAAANPSGPPDQVASRIMQKPIYPIAVHAVAFSPDGRLLATGDGTGQEIWFADFRGVIRGQGGEATPEDLSTVVFSPDGTSIAVGSTNGSVYLVSTESGKLLRQLSSPKE